MSEMRLYPHRGPWLLHANDAFVSGDGNSEEKMSTLEKWKEMYSWLDDGLMGS